ncbi:hypothetical protein Tco_0679040 [Tanacetum coccineum]|uniref:Uncharacterized protein n=1 Tax=Tanacetum coccineum TaxID=301880 RepID=A0ABQ4XGW6_9ASTR
MFDSRSSDVEDIHVNDRFAKVKGIHAVPPLMTGIYMPSKFDFRIDESKFTYGPKQFKTSESDAKTSDTASYESNSSVETPDSVSKLAVNEPTTVSKSKVWSDAPIIEEYESDSDDEYVIEPSKDQEKPSFAFVNTIKHVKTPKETIKEHNTYSLSHKADKRDWNGLMSKKLGLGYGFTKKACFVCVNAARQNPFSQAAETSTARKVNTARPIVNEIRPRNTFYKSHSPIRRQFNKSTAPKANFTNHKVNTDRVKIISAVRGYRETAVKASAGKKIVDDEAVHKELGDRMERAATTASSLKAEQDSGSGPSNHMANLEFYDKHNMIAYLQKSEGSEGFHQIIDFLNASDIQYALIRTITEASLRRHLKLEDNGGVTTLPNSKIFEQLALMGYATDSDKLTFQKDSVAYIASISAWQQPELLTSPNSSLMP